MVGYLRNATVATKLPASKHITINEERFAGVNFCVFHGFQEHRKSFSVNIHFIIQASYNGIVLVL